MKALGIIILCVLLLWSSTVSEAAFGIGDVVYDPSNYFQNLATAMTVAEQLRNQIKDLARLADLAAHITTVNDALRLVTIMSQLAVRMLGRYSRWYSMILVGDMVPCTVALLRDWQRIYDLDTRHVILDIARMSTLVSEGAQILASVEELLTVALKITGSVGGLQSLHAVLAKILSVSSGLQAMRGPMDEQEARISMRAMIVKDAHDVLSYNRLAGMKGLPRKSCRPMPEPNEPVG